MRAWVVALSLASGCDQALSLKHVPDIPPPPDAPMYCYGPTVDAAIGSDPDLDNKPSENDNCPDKMNADQADEDGDCLGDACDKCPWIATLDPSHGDSDLDGLADVCDPYAGGANIVYFEGFNDANEVAPHFLPNNWSVQNGAWHPAASFDVAIQNLDSGSGTIYIGLRLPSTTLRGTEPFMVGAWVLHYIDGSGRDTGGRIGLARDTDGLWLRVEHVTGGTTTLLGQHAVQPGELAEQLRFTVSYTTTSFGVSLETPSGVDINAGGSTTAPIGGAGVFALDTDVGFDYFVHVH